MNYRIDNIISKLIYNNKKLDKKILNFEFEILKINENRKENWFFILIFILIILVLIVYLISCLDSKINFFTLFLLILLILNFISILRTLTKGQATLIVNFQKKYIESINNSFLINFLFKRKKISFDEILKSELKEKKYYHEYSDNSIWLELSIIDKKGKKNVLTNFDIIYPNKIIANDVKYLIDEIIKNR